jgi:uncharacterized protein YndB with AHSA1/START domain
MKSNAASSKLQGELLITRVFDAPPEVVFQAWTDPKQMEQWWEPHRFTNPVCELDVRPGGARGASSCARPTAWNIYPPESTAKW